MPLSPAALRRLYWIDATLQREECLNAHHLAKALGVSPDTIRRDLTRLRDEYKAPVIYDPSRGGFRYGHACIPDLPDLALSDVLELGRALRRRDGSEGTAFERMAARLVEGLLSVLPDAALAKIAARGPRRGNAQAPSSESTRLERGAAGRRLGEGVRSPRPELEEPVTVRLRFDAAAGAELIKGGYLRREEAQLLTDGGLEASVSTQDPDALLLELLRWAPHFEIAGPAWVRRRLPTLLRGLLRHWTTGPRRGSGGKARRAAASRPRRRGSRTSA